MLSSPVPVVSLMVSVPGPASLYVFLPLDLLFRIGEECCLDIQGQRIPPYDDAIILVS